mmetsp:Transcript_57847/g.137659  ORF Transcript_57847/g.137659 Transcript_57847/m.137659 type:complete len:291 (+) Transcript_57847:97-969(+)
MAPLVVYVAKWTQPDYKEQAKRDNRVQLLTIPYSHYNEAARWALSKAKVDFEEHAFSPGEHILPLLKARVGGATKLVSASSTFGAETGKHYTAVPFAWLPDGSAGLDSWDIITNVAKFHAPPEDLKAFLDQVLGPVTRKYAYYNLMDPKFSAAWTGLCTHEKGPLSQALFHMAFNPILKGFFTKELGIGKEGAHDAAVAEVFEAFAQADEFLKTRKGNYFGGDAPNGTDIAFAALAAPVVMPSNYCGARFEKYFAAIRADPAVAQHTATLRATETGKFCLQMYGAHYVCK